MATCIQDACKRNLFKMLHSSGKKSQKKTQQAISLVHMPQFFSWRLSKNVFCTCRMDVQQWGGLTLKTSIKHFCYAWRAQTGAQAMLQSVDVAGIYEVWYNWTDCAIKQKQHMLGRHDAPLPSQGHLFSLSSMVWIATSIIVYSCTF